MGAFCSGCAAGVVEAEASPAAHVVRGRTTASPPLSDPASPLATPRPGTPLPAASDATDDRDGSFASCGSSRGDGVGGDAALRALAAPPPWRRLCDGAAQRGAAAALPQRVAEHVAPGPCRPRLYRGMAHQLYADAGNADVLRSGDVVYSFKYARGAQLPVEERRILALILDPTCFADEVRENNVLPLDMTDDAVLGGHIFVNQRCAFVLPAPLTSRDFSAELLSDAGFKRRTEQGNITIIDSDYVRSQVNTSRVQATVVPYLFYITIQLRASEIQDPIFKEAVSQHIMGGLRVDKVFLTERTKRDISKTNWHRKLKILIVIHDLPDGGCVYHVDLGTAMTGVPGWLAGLANPIGQAFGSNFSYLASSFRRELLRDHAHTVPAAPSVGSTTA